MSPEKPAVTSATGGMNPLVLWDNGDPDKGRADGCVNTNIGPGRSTKESDVAPIITPLHPEPQQHPLSRLDGCPDACGNTELPYRWEPTADGYRTYYGCEDCGQFWTADWKA